LTFYPVSLEVKGKLCLVVGGGRVAYRKVTSLLSHGALVKLVAPGIIEPLRDMARRGEIEHVRGDYRASLLEGVFLVFGATGSEEVNRRVAQDARERNLPVNIVDAPELCTFTVPAVMRRGDLSISVSTGGNSPALARSIREDLEKQYGEEFADLTRFLGKMRTYLLSNYPDPRERRRLLNCLGRVENARFYREGEGDILEEAVWHYLEYHKLF